MKILDSRFHGNDEIMPFSSCYESAMVDKFAESLFESPKPSPGGRGNYLLLSGRKLGRLSLI
jgi:hypothetical protein